MPLCIAWGQEMEGGVMYGDERNRQEDGRFGLAQNSAIRGSARAEEAEGPLGLANCKEDESFIIQNINQNTAETYNTREWGHIIVLNVYPSL